HFATAISLFSLSIGSGFAQNRGNSLPLFFFRNPGITNSEISFIVETPELRAGFRKDSVVFQLPNMNAAVHFAGANPDTRIDASNPQHGSVNFLIGERSHWSSGNATFGKITYHDLYPGIDMNYGGTTRRVKSEFVVA